jgi:hypothetical protein
MRLWSLHPRHLVAKGIVALWREGLLARAVLAGRTKGYLRHPQLDRFRGCADPVAALDGYLSRVLDEARVRGYAFDATKLEYRPSVGRRARLSSGQLAYEWDHLLRKLYVRDRRRWARSERESPEPHPSFRLVPGGLEPWERA